MVANRLDSDITPRSSENDDLRQAYERGRQDERATRRRRPVLMTFLFAGAAVGVALLAMAAVNGSFGRAGGVVDENLAVAADRAEPVVREAASDAKQSLESAADTARREVADKTR